MKYVLLLILICILSIQIHSKLHCRKAHKKVKFQQCNTNSDCGNGNCGKQKVCEY